MLTLIKRAISSAVVFVALTGAAQAAPVSVSDMQNQNRTGQNFNFTFDGLAASDGTGGTLVFHARGDYDGNGNNPRSETLSWNAEGEIGARRVGGFVQGANGLGGPFDFTNLFVRARNIEWQRTYELSGALLDGLLADSIVNIFVNLRNGVNVLNGPRYVEITLNYNTAPNLNRNVSPVPLPAGLPLFGTGLAVMGFVGWRRKQKQSEA